MSQYDPAISRPNGSSNARSTHRFPTQPDGERAVLADGRQRYLVRLVNHSADGFSVVHSGKLVLKEGLALRLHTNTGEHDVEIVWILADGKNTQVGLQRIAPPDETPAGSGLLYTAFLVGAIACGFLLVASHFIGHNASWAGETVSFLGKLREFVGR